MPLSPRVSALCGFRFLSAALLLTGSLCAHAAEIKVLSGNGAKAAGVALTTREPAAANAFVQFLAAPAAAPVLKAFGVER